MNVIKSIAVLVVAAGLCTLFAAAVLSAFLFNSVSSETLWAEAVFLSPIVLLAAVLVGLPTYFFGRHRGWFDTATRSISTGVSAGCIAGLLLSLATPGPLFSLVLFAIAACCGGMSGAIWWALVARQSHKLI